MSIKDPEPNDYVVIDASTARYGARFCYGDRAADIAEILYLRDWKAWAQRQLRSAWALERSVNEALNSGDGSYRP